MFPAPPEVQTPEAKPKALRKPKGPMAKYARWLGHWKNAYTHVTTQTHLMLLVRT